MSFASKVIQFNKELHFRGKLPTGIRIMNPFRDNPEILPATELFYSRFYDDNRPRKLILGINPGRLGAGATGIPFTDTKRLKAICGLSIESVSTHEPSSVFVYDMIAKYGGAESFYRHFFINSVCPLGFIRINSRGRWTNCNYYDEPELARVLRPFILRSLRKQSALGIDTETCFVLGKKNAHFLQEINEQEKIFRSIVMLEHPRFIQQYKSREREKYIETYLRKLTA